MVFSKQPETLLRLSENALDRGDFQSCKKFALQIQKSNPNFPGLTQILAVVNVLLSSLSPISQTHLNYYDILNIKPLSKDTNLLKENFMTLLSLLSPNKNPFAFADEALKLVRKAWTVLSDPVKKTQFDDLLKKKGFKCDEVVGTFWTVCPYCYHVYEFENIYNDCILKCFNEKCGKGFHGVAINTPPDDVLMAGKYACYGFYRVEKNGGGSSWTPFTPKNLEKEGGGGGKVDSEKENIVEISDDDDDVSSCNNGDKKVGNGERDLGVNGSKKPEMKTKRIKKTVGKDTKKIAGTGFRFRKKKIDVESESIGDELKKPKMEQGRNGEELMEGMKMEFFDGDDDDIFVSVGI